MLQEVCQERSSSKTTCLDQDLEDSNLKYQYGNQAQDFLEEEKTATNALQIYISLISTNELDRSF